MTGDAWIAESGTLTMPVMITNTHAVGVAHDAIIALGGRTAFPRWPSCGWLPVAAETYDGYLNDINGRHVTAEHVLAALDGARPDRSRRAPSAAAPA